MSATTGWSPFLSSSTRDIEQNDQYLAREIEMLERAVRNKVLIGRHELGELVGCRYWGPGRYGRALRAAVRQGRLTRLRRGVYAPGPASESD